MFPTFQKEISRLHGNHSIFQLSRRRHTKTFLFQSLPRDIVRIFDHLVSGKLRRTNCMKGRQRSAANAPESFGPFRTTRYLRKSQTARFSPIFSSSDFINAALDYFPLIARNPSAIGLNRFSSQSLHSGKAVLM